MLDLLFINGHVVDPTNGIDEVRPVAVYGGRIQPYEEGETARHVVDARGKLVFPGLIDAHAHLFYNGTEVGMDPDVAYLPTGVTSAVDCTAGVANYRLFRSAVVERSRVTIKSFLQMCSAGLVTTSYHECLDPEYFNAEKIERIYRENQDNILGLKIRQSEELVGEMGIEPLRRTVDIAGQIGCPVEVHCTNLPVPTQRVLELLRPGDIFEHVYQGVKNTILDEKGTLRDCVRMARAKGILFDTAEGRKHGDFDVMLSAMRQGFIADFCSTDLVLTSMYRRPVFSLPNLMSRYVAMGIPLKEVVRMTTQAPARMMGMEGEVGCLSAGARADMAVFDWLPIHQTYRDWKGSPFEANRLLKPEMTVKSGEIVYCAPDYIYEEEYR